MIGVKVKGSFSKTEKFLKNAKQLRIERILSKYGEKGVAALASATPIDSGLTAASWYYKIEVTSTHAKLIFCNSNVNRGIPIAIILQYGHATGTGGWVEGRDYINPALQPVFDELVNSTWEEVTKL
ncbi:MAG: HK97 gp10 family phage protein [Bacteroidales bacterium]|nr:HK97 gp10 family phage protein [Bacteroidales bacterium]